MPVIHPYAGGASGKGHGDDYIISNPYEACVVSAKWQMAMLALLLKNGGEGARKIKADFTPKFASKEEYFEFIEQLYSKGERIAYNEDGSVTVKP